MANTIQPKVNTPGVEVKFDKAEPAKRTTAAAEAQTANWQPVNGRQPSAAAQAIAPGSGAKEIMCPVLRALVNEGRVQLKADGSIDLNELKSAVKDLGASSALSNATWAIGSIGNKPGDILGNIIGHEMNVVNLPEGIVPHPADTQILRNGKFDEAKFNDLISHATKDGVMTETSFANAIAANYRRDLAAGADPKDAKLRGLNFAAVEFTGLLSVFGKTDPKTKEQSISVADLRTLYEKGQIAPGMQGLTSGVIEAGKLQLSLTRKVDANLAKSAFGSVATATGLAKAGARLAEGSGPETNTAGLTAMGAGKAANCPHLNGMAKMPPAPADVVNVHTRR